MHFAYFDESKPNAENPYFLLGGIIIDSGKMPELERIITLIQSNFFGRAVLTKEVELHGKDLFHGKGNFKGRKLAERVRLLKDIGDLVIEKEIPVSISRIHVARHREKYRYATPEYRLALMLFLDRFSDYLKQVDDFGMVFGDFEQDEYTQSIVDFSEFKIDGKTSLPHGRPLDRLIDTIYFTKSHHSRFLQIADVVLFLATRYFQSEKPFEKWHETEAKKVWETIWERKVTTIKDWP